MTDRASFPPWIGSLHYALGLVPFAWLLAFALVVGRGAWKLGHLPRYGIDPDSSAGWLFGVEFSLFVLSFLAVPAWTLLTALLLGTAPAVVRRNALSAGLGLLGIGAFVGVRLLQPDLFAWIAD